MPIIVITGASTGVGRAIALRFSAEGYTVCALARSEKKLAELVRSGAPSSGEIHVYPMDVRDAAQVETVFERIIADHGTIDILVNNAGVSYAAAVAEAGGPAGVGDPDVIGAAVVDCVIDTNLKGAMYCTFAALPVMRRAAHGSIFNIASIAGVDLLPAGSNGLYGASKHGLVAFSELIGRKYRGEGILVTTLCPGGIDTPLWNENNPYPYDGAEKIRPEEVADLIAYIQTQPRTTLFKSVIFVPVVEHW